MPDPQTFTQFRRLLVGVVIEILRDLRVDVDVSGLVASFEPESGFRMTWVDNWMRFRGVVEVPLRAPLAEAERRSLETHFLAVWDEIVDATRALPLADRFDVTRAEVRVEVGDRLRIQFDLEAD